MKTLPVSKRALIGRINRALAKRGECLKSIRGRILHGKRPWYVVSLKKNTVTQEKVNLEALGRELEVLNKFEHVEDRT